jgi:hypothetical protein
MTIRGKGRARIGASPTLEASPLVGATVAAVALSAALMPSAAGAAEGDLDRPSNVVSLGLVEQ